MIRWRQMFGKHRTIIAIVLGSVFLRVLFIANGGTGFFVDEGRFARGRNLLEYLTALDIKRALGVFIDLPDHNGFIALNLIPTLAHSLAARVLRQSLEETVWVPAVLLSLASVLTIALVYLIALRIGAKQREATIAALLMALSNTTLLYARHLFPYDSSLALLLWALWIGLVPAITYRRAFVTGLLIGAALIVYNAYWSAGGLIFIVIGGRIAHGNQQIDRRLLRIGLMGAGAALLPLFFIMISPLVSTSTYLANLSAFSATVDQGDFGEGWKFAFDFLWSIEGYMLLVWAVGGVAAIAAMRQHATPGRRRALLWLVMIIGLHVLTGVIGATILHKFVVYGRTVKQLIPFICLFAAFGIDHVVGRLNARSPRPAFAVYAAIVLVGALNIAPMFSIRDFPTTFRAQARRTIGVLIPNNTDIPGKLYPVTDGSTAYAAVNVGFLWPINQPIATPSPGTSVKKALHPASYPVYQYDGYGPEARAILRSRPVYMELFALP